MLNFKIFLLFLLFFISSCSTILSGSNQKVSFRSNIPESMVDIDGQYRGVTPLNTNIRKGISGQSIRVYKEGYTAVEIRPETYFDGLTLLNFLNIVGFGIDAMSGAMNHYNQKQFSFILKPKVLSK